TAGGGWSRRAPTSRPPAGARARRPRTAASPAPRLPGPRRPSSPTTGSGGTATTAPGSLPPSRSVEDSHRLLVQLAEASEVEVVRLELAPALQDRRPGDARLHGVLLVRLREQL